MNKLKPCPFCGGEAAQWETEKPFVNGWVGCRSCHCFINWIKKGKPLAITAWNTRPDRWIPVTERLPNKEGDYLVLCESGDMYNCFYEESIQEFGYYEAIYDSRTLGYVDSEWHKNETATHWMPLPEPPKGAE